MGRHDRQISQLKAANAADESQALRIDSRLKRDYAELSVSETLDLARQLAAIGDRKEARAEEIARLEKEND